MKLHAIEFDDHSKPKNITVSMPIDEAIAIAIVFGELNGNALSKLGLNMDEGPYDCLLGDVIHRYWEGGLEELFTGQISLDTLNS
jgi:hypothetical protein